MQIQFKSSHLPTSGTLFVGVYADRALSRVALSLNTSIKGAMDRAMTTSYFTGKVGETLTLLAPTGTAYDQVTLVGLGKKEGLVAQDALEIGAAIMAEAQKCTTATLEVVLDGVHGGKDLSAAKMAALVACGIQLRAYRFQKYRTQLKDKEKVHVTRVVVSTDDAKAAESAYAYESAVVPGVCMARDLMAETPNVLTPEAFATILKGLSELGVKVEVLTVAEMTKLGMGALLGVGQGSAFESRLVVMQWMGGKKGDAPIALVGKGVTFDTGGISIKPSNKMDEMKMDMTGAAVVSGAMKICALRKVPVNVVGVVGLVENMPDGNAQRPGDVVTSMSGQTIEILNTDAEGRLVLADALWYTQDRFKPTFMVNFATLTGAIRVTFGSKFAGIFSNNDALAEKLSRAGKATREYVWRLPLDARYDRDIDSKIADMKNIGEKGGGSITAAQFLERFVNKTPWAHVDIAGTAMGDDPYVLKGDACEPYGLRLIDELIVQEGASQKE